MIVNVLEAPGLSQTFDQFLEQSLEEKEDETRFTEMVFPSLNVSTGNKSYFR